MSRSMYVSQRDLEAKKVNDKEIEAAKNMQQRVEKMLGKNFTIYNPRYCIHFPAYGEWCKIRVSYNS